jgi:predicted transglutaminase-like cysteine proteinase
MLETRRVGVVVPTGLPVAALHGTPSELKRGFSRDGLNRLNMARRIFSRLRVSASNARSSARALTSAVLITIGTQASTAQAQTLGAIPVRLMPQGQIVSAPSGADHLCVNYSWACAHSGRRNTQITQEQLTQAIRINQRVNGSVRQISDMEQYGREDVWALPTARGGDCEDIALLKMLELIRAGLPPERLLLATVLDRDRQGHAVLVLRTGNGYYVLDNLTNEVRSWEQTGYTFIRMQNPNAPSTWVSVFAGGILRTLTS